MAPAADMQPGLFSCELAVVLAVVELSGRPAAAYGPGTVCGSATSRALPVQIDGQGFRNADKPGTSHHFIPHLDEPVVVIGQGFVVQVLNQPGAVTAFGFSDGGIERVVPPPQFQLIPDPEPWRPGNIEKNPRNQLAVR